MIRVTEESEALVVEGRLVGPWVTELRRVVRERLGRPGGAGLTLDLAAVSYVDAEGVSVLKELVAAGVRVRAASAFVAELLGRRA